MLSAKYIGIFLAILATFSAPVADAREIEFGPLCHTFNLTHTTGHRTEIAGPLFYHQQKEETETWAVPPLFSFTQNKATDWAEFDLLYPVIGVDRFGSEYRYHILQVFNFSGGHQSDVEEDVHRFSLVPFYFQQRSKDPEKNYTALIPLAGHLENRLFRDEVTFYLMPLYVKSRKKDVVTYNMPYPFFHIRRGKGLKGWQLWPLYGQESKQVTADTNIWNEIVVSGGHKKLFAPWPIFFKETTGIGTENPEKKIAVLPLFSSARSPQRNTFTAPWPIGLTITDDREKKYKEWGAPWPIIVFARGEGKHTSRIWPLFSRNRNDTMEKNWYLWPIYKVDRINAEPLERRRTRILFFLYSDTIEKNTQTETAFKRRDFWPLFSWRQDHQGRTDLQMLSILRPLFPNSKSIERNWSPIWSLWRTRSNPATQAKSQSLLWNLYRRDTAPESKKISLMFGLFKYQSSTDGKRWSLFHIPIGEKKK